MIFTYWERLSNLMKTSRYYCEHLFQMRHTRKVSVWPVGLSGGALVEKPRLSPANKVIGWDVEWAPTRKFATDMAGFAVSAALLISKPTAEFSVYSRIGLLETDFLSSLVTLKELEPKADLCTKVKFSCVSINVLMEISQISRKIKFSILCNQRLY